jgi:hypothetical protein
MRPLTARKTITSLPDVTLISGISDVRRDDRNQVGFFEIMRTGNRVWGRHVEAGNLTLETFDDTRTVAFIPLGSANMAPCARWLTRAVRPVISQHWRCHFNEQRIFVDFHSVEA